MALFDLLGRRWALRVLWELREGPLTFRELQRIAELEASGILDAGSEGYDLTQEGAHLLEPYPPVQAWAERWARRERASEAAGVRSDGGAG